MNYLQETIIQSIDLTNNTYIDSTGAIQTIVAQTAYLVPKTDGTHDRYVSDDNGVVSKQAGGGIQSVQPGTNVTVDNTDPLNPIVNSTGGETFAEKNASNIDSENAEIWREKLNVPEKPDEVLTIGEITTTTNSVSIALHSSGLNSVSINGIEYSKNTVSSFSFTSVSEFIKVLIVYALADSTVFYLAEGLEAQEAIEPELPEGALLVRRIIVDSVGQYVEPPVQANAVLREELAWKKQKINNISSPIILTYSSDSKASFWIEKNNGLGVPTIAGVTKPNTTGNQGKNIINSLYDGKEFWIYNYTGGDLILSSAGVTNNNALLLSDRNTPLILEDKQSCKLKVYGNSLEIVGVINVSTKAETDASNISPENAELWREKLNVSQNNINRILFATYSELGITPESTIEEKQTAIANFLEGYDNLETDNLFFEIEDDVVLWDGPFDSNSMSENMQNKLVEKIPLDSTIAPLTSSGDSPWIIQDTVKLFDKNTARSGLITDSQVSILEYNITPEPDTQVIFYYKVSSETNYDTFRILLNNSNISGPISGEVEWTKMVVNLIPNIQNTLTFEYTKDSSVLGGLDAVFISSISVKSPNGIKL